ncbi:MAG: hypothetical protein KKD28_12405 [Chloroflexi bacterium]|nr:hypothetical protein [Chloroflexota bacterium]MBU1662259.1 hypothetical protein [Chloroflexota bacterium]
MNMNTATILETSAQRLFPDWSSEQILAELLLERVKKKLIRYQTMARQFESKYGQQFDTFRQEILDTEPEFDVEQDYFDWELAVTGASDMKEEIKRLQAFGEPL